MITKCKFPGEQSGKKIHAKRSINRTVSNLVCDHTCDKTNCVNHSYDYSVLGLSWSPLGPIIINFLFSTETMVNQHTM